jgi:hypothetical protein
MVDKPVLVLGCGPKALAIAAKAQALRRVGFSVPEIVIIERNDVAAHWNGRFGYTDGEQQLGTPPEKDVGFPYRSDVKYRVGGIDADMVQYSWPAFQIEQGLYAEWVDRGRRQPKHELWAKYLSWVGRKSRVRVVSGEVFRVDQGKQWTLHYRHNGAEAKIEGRGLVITGPGDPVPLNGQPADSPRVLDGKTFWPSASRFDSLKAGGNGIGVIGSGETAAAIVVELLNRIQKGVGITVINRQGAVFSRGESFDENTLFTDPSSWNELDPLAKEEFMRRTDRGVFSVHTKRIIDGSEYVRHVPLEFERIDIVGGEPRVRGHYNGVEKNFGFDYIVNAMAFDTLCFRRLMPRPVRKKLRDRRSVEPLIQEDLSVRGIEPKLHLPMLAGPAQGPGFPNLSCLGLLSDRILGSYVGGRA